MFMGMLFFLQTKFLISILFPCCFFIAVKSFPDTLFCNQSAHSGSYNYPASSVQLSAPKQSCSEGEGVGPHSYFDNAY